MPLAVAVQYCLYNINNHNINFIDYIDYNKVIRNGFIAFKNYIIVSKVMLSWCYDCRDGRLPVWAPELLELQFRWNTSEIQFGFLHQRINSSLKMKYAKYANPHCLSRGHNESLLLLKHFKEEWRNEASGKMIKTNKFNWKFFIYFNLNARLIDRVEQKMFDLLLQ